MESLDSKKDMEILYFYIFFGSINISHLLDERCKLWQVIV